MKRVFVALMWVLAAWAGAAGEVRLVTDGPGAHLEIDGKPMLIVGGELGNSSAASKEDITANFARCALMNLNTVLMPVYWDLMEPREGEFDFTLLDTALTEARLNGLRIIPLWFGAWKNSMSCYAPEWVKTDTRRFPRAQTASGRPLEILSAFSEEVFRADSTAFIAMLRHIAQTDTASTVVMVQIENEIGMLEDARDHSAAADSAFRAGVPVSLRKGLSRRKLHPALAAHYNSGATSWDEAFGGPSPEADEAFMAWHYADYVGRLARAGKRVHDVPYYVNAAMNSRGRRPGEYPSAGPLAHLSDIWKTAAPDVALLAPDLYDPGFRQWAAAYALPDNPLFIPEIRRCDDNAAQAYCIAGAHSALGLSPFSIENGDIDPDNRSVRGFRALRDAGPMLLRHRNRGGFTEGVYFDMTDRDTVMTVGADNLRITASHFFTLPWDPRATDGSTWPAAGATIIRLGPLDYLVSGTGVVLKFEDPSEGTDTRQLGEDGFLATGTARSGGGAARGPQKRIGILSCDEVTPQPDGTFTYRRRLSGDETHQGRHVRISPDDFTTLRVKLYKY